MGFLFGFLVFLVIAVFLLAACLYPSWEDAKKGWLAFEAEEMRCATLRQSVKEYVARLERLVSDANDLECELERQRTENKDLHATLIAAEKVADERVVNVVNQRDHMASRLAEATEEVRDLKMRLDHCGGVLALKEQSLEGAAHQVEEVRARFKGKAERWRKNLQELDAMFADPLDEEVPF
jgi:uncharacterized protein (DUF3084 family)